MPHSHLFGGGVGHIIIRGQEKCDKGESHGNGSKDVENVLSMESPVVCHQSPLIYIVIPLLLRLKVVTQNKQRLLKMATILSVYADVLICIRLGPHIQR